MYTLRKLLLIVFNFRTENSNDTQQDLYQQQVQQTRGQSQYSNNKPVKIIRLRMQMVRLN